MKKFPRFFLIAVLILAFNPLAFASASSSVVKEALYKLRLDVSYADDFPLYNMDTYSRSAAGFKADAEYDLFPSLTGNMDIGFYGRYAFSDFIPCNLQLVSLYGSAFSDGVFLQWLYPEDYSLFLSVGLGCLICDVDFVSAEEGMIDDVYYDFMIESDLKLRKAFCSLKNADLAFDAGVHLGVYNEKSESFVSLGPCFGLTVDFKKIRETSGGKKN